MIHWQRWSATDIGNRRAQNEDALVLRDEDGFWAVVDGLGGQDAGNVASAALAHALEHLALAPALADAADQLEDVLLAVHEQLHDYAAQMQPARMLGCTLAVLRLTQSWGLLAWVGDVRVYRWRERQLTRLSEDHVGGPQHELTRLIGAEAMLPDLALLRVRDGDRYLICSDGLHAELDDSRLAHWLGREPAQAQRELVAEALASGGRDNLSFILLEVAVDAPSAGEAHVPS
ncbi:MAG: protein phosphatase 2C domain-containing protein [Perlucidibaca sp.]